MSKNYIGAKRKRTNTPAAARKRAVEYRHRPYKVKKPAVIPVEEIADLKDLAPVEEVAETVTEEVTEPEPALEQPEVSVPEPAGAASAAAAGGFFARAIRSIKGLFSKKEPVSEDPGLVSDVKTWINSPIDPEGETESAETDAAVSEPAEDTAAQMPAAETGADIAEDTEEDLSLTEETSAEDESETAEPADAEESEPAAETDETVAAEESADEAEPAEAEQSEEASAEESDTVLEEPADEEVPAEDETAELTDTEEEPAEDTDESDTAEETVDAETPAEEESETAEEETADEEVPAEDESSEQADTEEGEAEKEEEPQPEPEPELTKAEKKALKKAIRKETRIQLLDEIIDAPRAGILTMLLLPGRAMTKVGSIEKTTLAAPSVLILNVIKWASIGTFFAIFIEKFINIFNYSFIRLNFTGTAGLAFRFGIFGLIAEYVCYIVIGLFCGLIRKKISTLKLMEVESRSALAIALLFVIGCVLAWKDMYAFAVMAAAAGMVVGFVTKGYGMDLVLPIGKNTQLVLVMILTAAACYAGFRYFPLSVSGLMDIFRTILHL